MTEISFEHFDPEYELGNLDINGKPIKPRRKPGRKPNPPSPAQRKAQNRAAQRAFRERKRREMKEAENTIKKSMHLRDQALKDVKRLQTKLDEVTYENNFLKGQLLTLKIACMAYRVNVPKFWDTGCRDRMGSDMITYSRTKEIPQSLEFFLDRKRHIINLDTTLSVHGEETDVSHQTDSNYEEQQQQEYQLAMADFDHNLLSPQFSSTTAYSNSVTAAELNQPSSVNSDMTSYQTTLQDTSAIDKIPVLDLLNADFITNYILSNPTVTSSMDPALMEYILQPNIVNDIVTQIKDVPPELWLSLMPPEIAPLIPPEVKSMLPPQLSVEQLEQIMQTPTYPQQSQSTEPQPILLQPPNVPPQYPQHQQQEFRTASDDISDGLNNMKVDPDLPVEDDFWVDKKKPTTASNKVYVDGPISPLEAVTRMRTMREQNDNRYLLTPTELQRKIPHDPRIDLIPGPTMRDYMIIFQDFYDANELFNHLLESAMFIGGELGNPDCWFVPPGFLRKYWFLCPNYRPTRPDNSVELAVFLARKMLKALKRRKEMYILRDHYPNYFLSPNMAADDDFGQCLDENFNRCQQFDQVEASAASTPHTDEDNASNSSCTSQQHEQENIKRQQQLFDVNSGIDVLVINTLNKQDIPRITSPNAFTL